MVPNAREWHQESGQSFSLSCLTCLQVTTRIQCVCYPSKQQWCLLQRALFFRSRAGRS